jgi:threonine/homoserine/homoserine lactone efflux protein
LPLWQVFRSGFLSGSLNPKVGIFIMAFVPQFISTGQGSVAGQMLLLGGWFALLTTLGFGLMGISASHLARWIAARPDCRAEYQCRSGFYCSRFVRGVCQGGQA